MDGVFPWAGRAAPLDFPRASPSENLLEQLCFPSENPVHPSSFTWINPREVLLPIYWQAYKSNI